MKDKEFLQWIHDRLENVHGEHLLNDYMWKLRAIIASTDENKISPYTLNGFSK